MEHLVNFEISKMEILKIETLKMEISKIEMSKFGIFSSAELKLKAQAGLNGGNKKQYI